MKMTPIFYNLAKQILLTSASLQKQHPDIDSNLMDKLIELEESIVKPFGLPSHATEVNDMLQEFELFGDNSKRIVQGLQEQLTNFATWKLNTNAKTDLQLLQEAQENQLLFHQVMPYMGFYSTVFNQFLYKHCLLHLQLMPQQVLGYFNDLKNENSDLFKANRTMVDYENWIQWQELLRISNFPFHEAFGQYCQYQLYNIENIETILQVNHNLYHIRKIYFNEEALESEILLTDVCYYINKNWISAKLDIDKDIILRCLTEPINMHFQEVLQGRITRFFDDDEEDIDYVTPIDLVGDYGRGLITNKSTFTE
jgi:hypothetical protein